MSKEEFEPIDAPKKKWSFWLIGTGFFIVYFIGLMFLLEATLKPRESVVGAVIAYLLGILGLAIFAILVRSKKKAAATIPLLLIIVFGGGYLFHYVIPNVPVYNPFAPISERTELVLDAFEGVGQVIGNDSLPVDIETVEKYSQYAFLIDLVMALPLFIFGTIALVWLVQIFTEKPKILTIFSSLFAVVFLIIGLVIFPYAQLMVAGVVDLGSNFVPGALYVQEGAMIFAELDTASQAEIDEAIAKFYLASEYFQESAESLQGLKTMGVFALASLIPYYGKSLRVLTDNLYYMASATLELAGALGPFVNGTFQVMDGLDDAMSALGGTPISPTSPEGISAQGFEDINDVLFEQSILKIDQGILTLGDSIGALETAFAETENINLAEVYTALQDMGIASEEIEGSLDMVDDYLSMFGQGAITVLKALFTKPESGNFATFTHFLYGAYNLFKVGNLVGDISAFNGTSQYFSEATDNFTLVYSQLNTADVLAVANSDTPILNVTVSFVVDITGLSVSLCQFGTGVAQAFESLDGILDNLDIGYENVTTYPALIGQVDDLVSITDDLVITAALVDANVSIVHDKATNQEYGVMSDPALQFSDLLNQFDFTTNVVNANAIAHSFLHLFYAMEALSYTYNNVTAAFVDFGDTNYVDALAKFEAANNSLTAARYHINESIIWMEHAQSLGGMIQLDTTIAALQAINTGLETVNTEIDIILGIDWLGDPGSAASTVETSVDNIVDALVQVNIDLQNVAAQ